MIRQTGGSAFSLTSTKIRIPILGHLQGRFPGDHPELAAVASTPANWG